MFGSTNLGFGNFSSGAGQALSPFGGAGAAASNTSPFAAKPLSLFGASQPSLTFGAGLTFGAAAQPTSAFGQTSTASQPSGVFGSNNSSASPFGQGSTSGFGATTNSFGAQPQLTSLFGAQQNKPAFGAPSNPTPAFGSNAAASPFGGSAFGLLTSALSNPSNVDPNVNNGSMAKPYNPHVEKDLTGASTNFRAISCMPEYRNFSFEELRLKDYEQNNRFPNPQAANQQQAPFGANQSLPFGAPKPASGFGSAFGGLSTFGAQPNSPFGSGAQSTGLAFGAPAQNNALPFGAQPASGFGSAAGNTFGSASSPFGAKPAFGQPNPSAGAFGQNNANTASPFGAQLNSAFGAAQPQQNAFGASPFGQTSTNTGFGQANNASPFGASNTNASNTSGGLFGQSNTSGFGANTQNQQSGFGQAGQAGVFGGQASNAFGANKPATGFGATGQTSGGLFGNTNNNNTATQPGLFGQNSNAANQPQLGGLFAPKPAGQGGLFGQNTNTAGTAPQGGLFGGAQTGQAQTSGGLFGAKPAQPASGGGLFGGQQNSGGMFGQANQNSLAGGLFGAKPAQLGGLFGNNGASASTTGAAPQNGLFGNNANNNSAPSQGLFGGNTSSTLGGASSGGGLFGNKPAGQTTSGGLFGANNNNNANTNQPSGGLFGGGAQNQGANTGLFGSQNQNQNQNNSQNSQPNFAAQQQHLQQLAQQSLATINATNPYGNNPLFQSITVPPQFNQANADPNVVLVKSAQKPVTLGSVGYRKFALFRPLVYSQHHKSPSLDSIPSSPSTPSTPSLFGKSSEEAIRECDVFFPPAPQGFKKLVLDKSKPPSASTLFNDVTSRTADAPKRVDFAVSNDGVANAPIESNDVLRSLTPVGVAPSALRSPRVVSPRASSRDNVTVNKDGYWMMPSIAELGRRTLSELRKVEHFKVGRQHYGQVEFLEPVDLSTFANFDEIYNVIQFTSKVCDIYPNDDAPLPGEGLNIPVKITLEGCFPTNKKDKLPIVDPHDEIVKQHIANLKSIPVEFVAYEPESGAWSFIVRDCRRQDDDADGDDVDRESI